MARGERVAVLGPNGAGRTTLVLHLDGTLAGTAGTGRGSAGSAASRGAEDDVAEVRQRVGLVFQDPDDQFFMPTVGRTSPSARPISGLRGARARHARGTRRWSRSAWPDVPDPGHRTTSLRSTAPGRGRHGARHAAERCWPWTNHQSQPGPQRVGASWPTSCVGLDVTKSNPPHNLPYALELCPRSVILDNGIIVADGITPRRARRPGADGEAPARTAITASTRRWHSPASGPAPPEPVPGPLTGAPRRLPYLQVM